MRSSCPADAHRIRWLDVTRATAVFTGLALIVGIEATWTVISVGHSGAKATWNDVSRNAPDGGNDSGRGGDDD